MRDLSDRRFHHVLLLIILTVAGFLRFWKFGGIPFMHDEFSALFRTQYDSFSDLIKLGVMLNDTHPAGVQLFLFYWVKLTGFSEGWIKLPFALMGLASVWLVYSIGRRLFNEVSGLIAASFVGVMQFFVFYSQLARPYAAGLFFSLWMVSLWSKTIVSNKVQTITWILFAVSLVATSLMHAFSMFLALLVYLSGFLLLRREHIRPYLLSGFAAALLYIPHIPVFWQQLKAGTIGGWLGPPDDSFIPGFFGYSLHFSLVFVVISFAMLLLAMYDAVTNRSWLKIRIVFISWFVITFVTAWLYSIYRSPIIQYSTLYFATPFFILAIFAFQPKLNKSLISLIVAAILLAGSCSLIVDRQHYHFMYEQGYDGLAADYSRDLDASANLPLITWTSNRKIPEFYLNTVKPKNTFHFARNSKLNELRQCLDTLSHDSLAFAWTDYAPADWAELALLYFPEVISYSARFNSEYFLLRRSQPERNRNHMPHLGRNLIAALNIAPSGAESFVPFDTDTGEFFAIDLGFKPDRKYGPLYQQTIAESGIQKDQIFVVAAKITALDTISNLKIVLEMKSLSDDSLVHWQAGDTDKGIIYPGGNLFLVTAMRLGRDIPYNSDFLIRSYIWNPEGKAFRLHGHIVYSRPIQSEIFSLFEPLP